LHTPSRTKDRDAILAELPEIEAVLQSRKHDHDVQLYPFDMLAGDGDSTASLPLALRKTNLARLLSRRAERIFIAPFERGEIGPDLFRHACLMGLEGLVSEHGARTYGAGRWKHWIKVKNPARNKRAAVGALADDAGMSRANAAELLGAIEKRHEPISEAFVQMPACV
jgi:ATP-dependent DNA ligase